MHILLSFFLEKSDETESPEFPGVPVFWKKNVGNITVFAENRFDVIFGSALWKIVFTADSDGKEVGWVVSWASAVAFI